MERIRSRVRNCLYATFHHPTITSKRYNLLNWFTKRENIGIGFEEWGRTWTYTSELYRAGCPNCRDSNNLLLVVMTLCNEWSCEEAVVNKPNKHRAGGEGSDTKILKCRAYYFQLLASHTLADDALGGRTKTTPLYATLRVAPMVTYAAGIGLAEFVIISSWSYQQHIKIKLMIKPTRGSRCRTGAGGAGGLLRGGLLRSARTGHGNCNETAYSNQCVSSFRIVCVTGI